MPRSAQVLCTRQSRFRWSAGAPARTRRDRRNHFACSDRTGLTPLTREPQFGAVAPRVARTLRASQPESVADSTATRNRSMAGGAVEVFGMVASWVLERGTSIVRQTDRNWPAAGLGTVKPSRKLEGSSPPPATVRRKGLPEESSSRLGEPDRIQANGRDSGSVGLPPRRPSAISTRDTRGGDYLRAYQRRQRRCGVSSGWRPAAALTVHNGDLPSAVAAVDASCRTAGPGRDTQPLLACHLRAVCQRGRA